MKKKIGNVILDYTFYPNKDFYSDGKIENTILEAFQSGTQKELLLSSTQWPILYHVSDVRENLLEWYPFKADAEILEVGSGCGALTGLLSRKAKYVTCIELSEKRSLINAYRNKECNNIEIILGNFQDIKIHKKYDYVTLIGVWEYAGLYVSDEQPYFAMLKKVKEYLKPGGKIFIAIENKMGMKYFNGAPEDHTGKIYSGLNDYVGEKNIRTFSKQEIKEILEQVGIDEYSFYYPLPDYKLPRVIYSDTYLPNPGDVRCFKEDYSQDRVYNFNDAAAFDQVCRDQMFSYFSNSYLVVCGERESFYSFSKYSRMRKKEYRISTSIIEKNGKKYVVKKALNEAAQNHILKQKDNEDKWKHTLANISYAEGEIVHGEYWVPYISGEDVDHYLFQWRNNPTMFIAKVKELIENKLAPSEQESIPFRLTEEFKKVFGDCAPLQGLSLKVTNMDLLFSNLKITENGLFNFDYEWVFDFEIPYEYVIWRALYQLYDKYAAYLKAHFTKKQFLALLGINEENIPIYEVMEKSFSEYVHGKNNKENYLSLYQKRAIMQGVRWI